MKVAVIYNTKSERVINAFGARNQERYGKRSIARIVDCLKRGGHQVRAFEGDKDLIDNLEEFMPRVIKGERPGMAFNLAYGIQGQARYTHVPSILEMVGIPYVGSGPLAHSLALDKVIAKMVFAQHGLPTPEFAVLQSVDDRIPDLRYPLIVKPRNEAVSFGIKIVNDEDELREAAKVIFDRFQQPVLVERYIAGREVNVGLLGNNDPEALPPAELLFGEGGPQIYTYEDKTRRSGREVRVQCPADLDEETTRTVQSLAVKAFKALGCNDCARVDMRLDEHNNPYILEINSLPSLGEHGSYVQGAQAVGLDFCALVNRLVDVASARYFGTPQPMQVTGGGDEGLLEFVTARRERIERRIESWTRMSSRTHDTVGLIAAFDKLDRSLTEQGMRRRPLEVEPHVAALWETAAGLDGGTLLIGHVDTPLPADAVVPVFHREPEWITGEGIGSSRAPLVAMEFALQALRSRRKLSKARLGVLYYGDEGRGCAQSAGLIRAAAARARQVLVLRPGNPGDRFIVQRRGVRRFDVRISGPVYKLGHAHKRPEVLRWAWTQLERCSELSSRKQRVGVSVVDLHTNAFQNLLPHEVRATLLINYLDPEVADTVEEQARSILSGGSGIKVRMSRVGDRPPFRRSPANEQLAGRLRKAAERWEIPYAEDSSLLPSAAGLVPSPTAVICGVGPAATEAFTSQESVERISVVQRTLLLAEFLFQESQA